MAAYQQPLHRTTHPAAAGRPRGASSCPPGEGTACPPSPAEKSPRGHRVQRLEVTSCRAATRYVVRAHCNAVVCDPAPYTLADGGRVVQEGAVGGDAVEEDGTRMAAQDVRDDLHGALARLLQQDGLSRQHKVDQADGGTSSHLTGSGCGQHSHAKHSRPMATSSVSPWAYRAHMSRRDAVTAGAVLQVKSCGLGCRPLEEDSVFAVAILRVLGHNRRAKSIP